MVIQQTHVEASVGMAGLDATIVQIGLMAILILGAAIAALIGSFAVLVLVPLAAVVVRRHHGRRAQPSRGPGTTDETVPFRGVGPRHANVTRNT